MKTFNLFISHSWAHGNAYNRLEGLLNKRPYFRYRNYSVPKHNPVHTNGTDAQLEDAILQHMQPCSIVIVLAGVYATYSKWIKKEIVMAKTGFASPKPVLAVELWGSQKTSAYVRLHADHTVSWNTESIVSAIREMA